MRKVSAIFLTMGLSASMTIGALAANETLNNAGTATANVTANYNAGSGNDLIYHVDLAWGSMEFTYKAASKGTWNTEDHVYENATAAQWTYAEGANAINITNHSNAAIQVTPSYTAEMAYSAVAMSFSSAKLKVDSADNGKGSEGTGQEEKGTITVTPSGALPEKTKDQTIGTITLTIEQYVDDGMLYHVGDTVNDYNVVYKADANNAYIISKNMQNLTLSTLSNARSYPAFFTAVQEALTAGCISIPEGTQIVASLSSGISYFYTYQNGTLTQGAQVTDYNTPYNLFLTESVSNKKG